MSAVLGFCVGVVVGSGLVVGGLIVGLWVVVRGAERCEEDRS